MVCNYGGLRFGVGILLRLRSWLLSYVGAETPPSGWGASPGSVWVTQADRGSYREDPSSPLVDSSSSFALWDWGGFRPRNRFCRPCTYSVMLSILDRCDVCTDCDLTDLFNRCSHYRCYTYWPTQPVLSTKLTMCSYGVDLFLRSW